MTSTFYPIASLSVFDAKRVLQLVMFAGLLLFAVAWVPLRQATLRQIARVPLWMGSLISLFFAIGLVSALRLEHPAYPLIDVSMMFVLLVAVFAVAGSRDLAGDNFDRWALGLLAFTGFAVAFQEFMGFTVGWVQGSEFSYQEALIHFAHPRFFNHLQTLTIPLIAVLPIMFRKIRWIRIVCI